MSLVCSSLSEVGKIKNLLTSALEFGGASLSLLQADGEILEARTVARCSRWEGKETEMRWFMPTGGTLYTKKLLEQLFNSP